MNIRTCDRPRGFSIVELLVVIGIIAVLVSFLMPAIAREKEQARRVICASNLRQWGGVATNFAFDHQGWLPRAFRNHFDGTHAAWPIILNDRDVDEYQIDPTYHIPQWMLYGSPWSTFKKYGMTDKVAICPSSGVDAVAFNFDYGDGNWTPYAATTYMYFANVNSNTGFEQSIHNHARVPTRLHDPIGPIAADIVYRGGGPQNGFGSGGNVAPDTIVINHIWTNPFMPDAQNVLYSDGKVVQLNAAAYLPDAQQKLRLPDSSHGGTSPGHKDWSLIHFPDGGVFYWEGTH